MGGARGRPHPQLLRLPGPLHSITNMYLAPPPRHMIVHAYNFLLFYPGQAYFSCNRKEQPCVSHIFLGSKGLSLVPTLPLIQSLGTSYCLMGPALYTYNFHEADSEEGNTASFCLSVEKHACLRRLGNRSTKGLVSSVHRNRNRSVIICTSEAGEEGGRKERCLLQDCLQGLGHWYQGVGRGPWTRCNTPIEVCFCWKFNSGTFTQ